LRLAVAAGTCKEGFQPSPEAEQLLLGFLLPAQVFLIKEIISGAVLKYINNISTASLLNS
jgi:hypothetical protein